MPARRARPSRAATLVSETGLGECRAEASRIASCHLVGAGRKDECTRVVIDGAASVEQYMAEARDHQMIL
jgi:hypothetical protein